MYFFKPDIHERITLPKPPLRDEDEISRDMLYKWFNNRYIVIKYLGRGTFCRVWMVYDVVISNYQIKIKKPGISS